MAWIQRHRDVNDRLCPEGACLTQHIQLRSSNEYFLLEYNQKEAKQVPII